MLSTDHARLLGKLSKNLNQHALIQAYCDLLQEEGNPGWFVVKNYNPVFWLNIAAQRNWRHGSLRRIPWLDGYVHLDHTKVNVTNWRSVLKYVLAAYARGDAVPSADEPDEDDADELDPEDDE